MISLLLLLITISISFVFITHAKRIGYLKGRLNGWKACEDMAIKRAEEHNYDKDKFLSDILQ